MTASPVGTSVVDGTTTPTGAPPRGGARRGRGLRRNETAAGWTFTLPMLVILGLFLFVPVVMALWVSFSDWRGRGSPFGADVSFVGLENYASITTEQGLPRRDFGLALRNNAWYVLLVVPLQTALSLFLAVLVNRAVLRGRGFFRTAFYFPSVTSSVAITILWLFLFSSTGVVNTVLSWVGLSGPNWFNDPSGVVHNALAAVGITQPPPALADGSMLGVTWWEWLGGPSVAMSAFVLMAVFTTSGTFMLIFLAALQNIGGETYEAALMDGTNAWQRFWRVTLPQLRTALFTVLTLGLIGCWQVFDQIYTGTQGGPGKTTLTPAYLSYDAAFLGQRWGEGAAIAFVLFVIIVAFTLLQRWVLRERPVSKRRARAYQPATVPPPATGTSAPGSSATTERSSR